METTTMFVSVEADEAVGFVDLTDDLHAAVERSGIRQGMALVFSQHTTCGLVVNEREAGLRDDFRCRLDALVPQDGYYAHDDATRRTENLDGAHEPRNGRAHVAQLLMGGSSQVVPVVDGRAVLERWQRLFLIELDAPRARTVVISVFGR